GAGSQPRARSATTGAPSSASTTLASTISARSRHEEAVVDWDAFAEEAPELARLGRERFERTGVCLIGTLRADGSPRISPIEPYVVRGELLLGMMWQSRKARDLLRDPRIVVHSAVSNKDGTEGDFKLYGRV